MKPLVERSSGVCPVCGGRGWHTAGGNDPSPCGRCAAGQAFSDGPLSGLDLIDAERERQMSDEGWTHEHDDIHRHGELADAAAVLAATEPIYVQRAQVDQRRRYSEGHMFVSPWPYELDTIHGVWMPWRRAQADRVRELVKAGALIAAEIDRLQRSAVTGPSDD